MHFSTNHLCLAEPAHFGRLLSKTFERVSQGVAVGKKGVGAKKRGRHVALIQSRCILANLIFDIIIVKAIYRVFFSSGKPPKSSKNKKLI